MDLRPALILALILPLAMPGPAHAHHSRAMFEMDRNITHRGVVREYRWQNPHSHIVIAVGTQTWDIEASAVDLMTSRGWTRTTFKPGDRITAVTHPNRDGSNNVLLFYVILPDGKRLYRAQHRYDLEVEDR